MPRLYLGGASFTPDQLATLIERRIAAANAHDAAEDAWADRAHTYCDLDDMLEPAMRDLRRMAPMLFGPKSPVLDALGLRRPPRRSGPTPAAKGAALERRRRAHEEIPPTLPASQLPCGGRS
jgi:hypothetical protein